MRATLCIFVLASFLAGVTGAGELELVGTFAGLNAPAEQALAGPVDMAVGQDGMLYVLDWKAGDVKTYSRDGRFLRVIGRSGSGPGEFLQPSRIGLVGDSIYVADNGNGRVQVLLRSGAFVRSYEVPVSHGGEAVCFDSEGNLYIGKGGLRSKKLVQVYDNHGRLVGEFGDLEGRSVEFLNFTQIKKQIAKGEVPDYFKNRVRIAVSGAGEVHLAHQGIARLKKFSKSGELLWAVELEAAELKRIYQNFLERNRELMDQPATLASLSFVNDVDIDGRGSVYLLLNWPAELVVYVYSREGEFVGRQHASVAEPAVLALSRRSELYVFSRETYQIYRYRIKGDSE